MGRIIPYVMENKNAWNHQPVNIMMMIMMMMMMMVMMMMMKLMMMMMVMMVMIMMMMMMMVVWWLAMTICRLFHGLWTKLPLETNHMGFNQRFWWCLIHQTDGLIIEWWIDGCRGVSKMGKHTTLCFLNEETTCRPLIASELCYFFLFLVEL